MAINAINRALLAMLATGAILAGCTSASMDASDFRLTSVSGATPVDVVDFGLAVPAIRAPEELPVHGIDISKYQGEVDWAAAREGGVAFAWLKATEGGDRVDDRFAENWREARAAGVPRGAYHFFYHCRPGIEQAEWFIRNVPRDPLALPPVLDVEWTPFSPTCTRRPPREELVREMKAFLDAVEDHYGVRPLIYAPIDVHRDRLVGAFPRHEFWLRSVADHPDNVYEDRDFRLWQWTATGTVPGIEGEVDRNAFAGTREDWAKWLAAHRPS